MIPSNLITNFKDFLENWIKDRVSKSSWEFLRNFSFRNFWEILRTLSLILRIIGELHKRHSLVKFLRISGEFTWNISPKIHEKFKCLKIQTRRQFQYDQNQLKDLVGYTSKKLEWQYRYLLRCSLLLGLSPN